MRKEAGEFPRRHVVGGLVGPGVARHEHLGRHARAGGDRVEPKHVVGGRRGGLQVARMDRIDDRAGDRQLHPLADAIRPATPAGVHEPDVHLVAADLLGKETGILHRMPDEERPAEAG